jgi:beta-lactamase superfamily II metal-dependent hydrolase
MEPTHAIAVDLARVFADTRGKTFLRTLAWGDYVEVIRPDQPPADHVPIRLVEFREEPDGSIVPSAERTGHILLRDGAKMEDVVVPVKKSEVLKVNFVDVQQGDGMVIETPGGKVILVDGGDNQLFARYLAGRFRGTSIENPREIDCIVVTHGDADHFLGLTEILRSESNDRALKRLFMRPRRVYHNGLVKRPGTVGGRSRPEKEMLGPTVEVDGRLMLTGLVDDLLQVGESEMNLPFREWREALSTYAARAGAQPLEIRRLQRGDDDAFRFLREGGGADAQLRVEVLGPLVETIEGQPALPFLREPPKDPRVGQVEERRMGSYSASHTINGHSVVLRLKYRNVHFLLAGDLNEESEATLVAQAKSQLRAEVFKVPHHGSADFSPGFLKAVKPVVSVVSSGDESARKEYIHPRANLVGALGRFSRVDEPLVFVTELVAFFNMVGFVEPERHVRSGEEWIIENGRVKELSASKRTPPFFGFERTAFGLVKIRTDGRRVVVYTDSGNVKLKEAYAFEVSGRGTTTMQKVRQA